MKKSGYAELILCSILTPHSLLNVIFIKCYFCICFRDLDEALEMGIDWSLREGMRKAIDNLYPKYVTR